MTEATQVNAAIRRHVGPFGAFRRLEASSGPGWPDWHWAMRGRSGWIEAKLMTLTGRPEKLTLDQVVFGEEETRHGGERSWIIFGLEPRRRLWTAHDAAGARTLFDGAPAIPVLAVTGAFPTRDLVRYLTGE